MIVERIARVFRYERIVVPMAALAFGAVFNYPILAHLSVAGTIDDWDQQLQYQEAAYQTVLRYHQFPWWNPWKCGGVPLLGNPQSHILTPWFLLTLLFGPVVGLHLEITLHIAAAWAGTYLLARVTGAHKLSAAGAATAFAGSSWFYLHACVGHVPFFSFAYLPLVVALAWITAEGGQFVCAALSGAILALCFTEGYPYTVTFVALTLSLLMLPLAIMQRSLRAILALALAGIFAAGLSAFKLLPAYYLTLAHPHFTDAGPANSLRGLAVAFFSRNQDRGRLSPIPVYQFHELGAYVGLFAIPAFAGLLSPRRAAPWLFAGTVLLLLARGNTGPHALWTKLHWLPFISQMRAPSRFTIPIVLTVAMMAALGFDFLLMRHSRWWSAVAVVLILAGGLDDFAVATPNLYYALRNPMATKVRVERFRQSWLSGWGPHQMMYAATVENFGVPFCYEYTSTYWPTSVTYPGSPSYRGEQRLEGDGVVRIESWSPNALTYQVDARGPAVLVINQNYDAEWRLVMGQGEVVDHQGLLAIRVPQGRQRVEIAYRDHLALVGALIGFVTLLAGIGLASSVRARACAWSKLHPA